MTSGGELGGHEPLRLQRRETTTMLEPTSHQVSTTCSEIAGAPPGIRVRTPHVTTLSSALDARDHRYERIANDTLRVHGVPPDDLGWLAAQAGVVIYEMTVEPAVSGTP